MPCLNSKKLFGPSAKQFHMVGGCGKDRRIETPLNDEISSTCPGGNHGALHMPGFSRTHSFSSLPSTSGGTESRRGIKKKDIDTDQTKSKSKSKP